MDRNFVFLLLAVFVIVALRKESVDRNILPIPTSQTSLRSLSARRAWIEIQSLWPSYRCTVVALRKESVDRNSTGSANFRACIVALRKESVDRNLWWGVRKAVGSLSLSARRAWIEIVYPGTWSGSILVALRKESVDRNFDTMQIVIIVMQSLSARRAWIEMRGKFALSLLTYRRSPQGERG